MPITLIIACQYLGTCKLRVCDIKAWTSVWIKFYCFSFSCILAIKGTVRNLDLLVLYLDSCSISLLYDSVSKYASIKCLCDNSRHAVILLTFSAWMACIYECGLFLKCRAWKEEKKKRRKVMKHYFLPLR